MKLRASAEFFKIAVCQSFPREIRRKGHVRKQGNRESLQVRVAVSVVVIGRPAGIASAMWLPEPNLIPPDEIPTF